MKHITNPVNSLCYVTTCEYKGYIRNMLPMARNVKYTLNGNFISEVDEIGKWRFFDKRDNPDNVLCGHIEEVVFESTGTHPEGIVSDGVSSNVSLGVTTWPMAAFVVDDVIIQESSAAEDNSLKISTLPDKYREYTDNNANWTAGPMITPTQTSTSTTSPLNNILPFDIGLYYP